MDTQSSLKNLPLNVCCTSVEGDEEYLATIKREMKYTHWSDEQRKIFELCLKWFYETHSV